MRIQRLSMKSELIMLCEINKTKNQQLIIMSKTINLSILKQTDAMMMMQLTGERRSIFHLSVHVLMPKC